MYLLLSKLIHLLHVGPPADSHFVLAYPAALPPSLLHSHFHCILVFEALLLIFLLEKHLYYDQISSNRSPFLKGNPSQQWSLATVEEMELELEHWKNLEEEGILQYLEQGGAVEDALDVQ